MLKNIYQNPIRLFVIVASLALLGIYCGLKLPMSLYPQSSRPVVRMMVSYGGYSSNEFIKKFGANFESQLEGIKNTGNKIEHVDGEYAATSVIYTVMFDWQVPYNQALKEVQDVAASFKGILPKESADSISIWQWSNNAGFLAVSFYSHKHTLSQLYDILDPILGPELKKNQDSEDIGLWNPESQEVSVKLNSEKLTLYGLLPRHIYREIEAALPSMTGSSLKVGTESANFEIPSHLTDASSLENLSISLPNGKTIFLKDVATVVSGKSESQNRTFKTNGKDSLILFAEPKSGANVKRMAENVIKLIKEKEHLFPVGVEYRELVDPSEFIRGSIRSLISDVVLAALLAVAVLFLFIGNFKNVATAAIEIPLSMAIAFIVMYFMDMNLNLISLGGLALAAGMNVDASVVVLENIFKHQERWVQMNTGHISPSQRLALITGAVSEVAVPIFISIATTLIVFIPLTLTTDLTSAILGDLAKAVIYSHGVSGFVAIFVVPAIRLKLMPKNLNKLSSAPLEKQLAWLASSYTKFLEKFLGNKKWRYTTMLAPIVLCALLVFSITPRLPKEIVGTPDTDWVFLWLQAPKAETNRHFENILQEMESKALKTLGDHASYTFVQSHGGKQGTIMLRLKDKSKMTEMIKLMQQEFRNTPDIYFHADQWNPAELPLPEMFHFEMQVTGKDTSSIVETASRIRYFMNNSGDYDRIQSKPGGLHTFAYQFKPFESVWKSMQASSLSLLQSDIVDLTFYANGGKNPGSMMVNGKMTPVKVVFEDELLQRPEVLSAYPFKIGDKVVPLSALGSMTMDRIPGQIFRRQGREKVVISTKLDKEKERSWEKLANKYNDLIKKNMPALVAGSGATIEILPPQKELLQALDQIKTSLGISLLLVFLVLWLQFQSLKQVGIIMMTIPLGVIGVLLALFAFNSTLSLNSALGIILLNGMTVNNSILLMEVFNQQREKGLTARQAILEACQSRLRPILITTLTTILGMVPIAMGWGDGGKILQPLGISVVFGMLLSCPLTLIIVPLLMYREDGPNEKREVENDFSDRERYSEAGVQPWQ